MERKNVKIKMRSTRHDVENIPEENIYSGHYAYKDGIHLLSYEESSDSDSPGSMTKNLYKISDHSLYLSKHGAITAKMLFDTKKKHQSIYKTPFGSFELLLHTKHVNIDASHETLTVFLNYDLFLNKNFISNCTIDMTILF